MTHLPQTDDAPDGITQLTPSRRHVLRGVAAAGAVVAGGGLVACGSDEPDSPGGQAPGTGDTATPSESASGSPSGSPSASAAALAKTTDIPVGGGVIFEDARVVVTQPSAGDFKGFTAVCTHQGCTVGQVGDGLITCPCHGSQYSVEDGSVQRGPATAGLSAKNLTVDGDNILLS